VPAERLVSILIAARDTRADTGCDPLGDTIAVVALKKKQPGASRLPVALSEKAGRG